jgi:hypothetical protein
VVAGAGAASFDEHPTIASMMLNVGMTMRMIKNYPTSTDNQIISKAKAPKRGLPAGSAFLVSTHASGPVFALNLATLSHERSKPDKPSSLGGRDLVLVAKNVGQPIDLGNQPRAFRVVAFGQPRDRLTFHQGRPGLSCNGNHCTGCHSQNCLSAQSAHLH